MKRSAHLLLLCIPLLAGCAATRPTTLDRAEKWRAQRDAGEITPQDYEWLVCGQNDLAVK